MPFTVSHAVVALPFVRSPLPFGAIAVGAMAPDLPLFFSVAPPYSVTHGFPGFLVTTVPLALVLYAVWRLLLRPASPRLLPTRLGSRLPPSWAHARLPSIRELPLIAVALVLGVVSHIVWDEFTHPGRFGSTLLPGLADDWGPLAGTQWLQYASSIGGLVVLAVVGRRHLAGTRPEPVTVFPRLRAALGVAIVLVGAASVTLTLGRSGLPTTATDLRSFTFDAGTSAGAAILVVTAAAALAAAVIASAVPRRDP